MTYKNGEPVLIEDENGLLVPGYTFDAGSVLRGAELLGRHLKMFTDKVEHGGTGGGSLEMITRIELVAAVSGSNITLGEAAV
jgi:phage terminase small subunit